MSIAEATKAGETINAKAISALVREMSDGNTDAPEAEIEASVQAWRVAADLAIRLGLPNGPLHAR